MNVLQQWLWLGLLTLPAILLLHLLRERSKRQPISSLELWRWLEKELRGPRLRRLPVTWVLLLQLLAALFLNLALSQPQLTLARLIPGRQHLILIVDTSSSMGAQDVQPSRLAQAQAAAAARLATLGENDRVTLISAGPAARQLGSATGESLGDLNGRLAALRAAGDGSDWPGSLALATAAIEPDLNNQVVVYTDGAFEMSSTIAEVSLPAEVEITLVGQPQANQAVVTLAVRPSSSGAVQVFARLANFSDTPAERTLTLFADGRSRDELVVTLPASGVSEQAWTLPPGIRTVSVSLGGSGDVLPADDSAAVGVLGTTTLEGVLVAVDPAADATLVLERALRSLPNLHLITVTPENYASYENYDLTVFSGWLPNTWPRGGVLVMAPPEGLGLLNVQPPTTVGALPAAPTDSLLADVDLGPVDFGRGSLLEAPDWLTPVLTDERGLTLVWRGATQDSRLVVFTFGLERGNLARRTSFPVLMANAVAEVLPPPLPASIAPGEPVGLPPAHRLPFLTITDPTGAEHTFTGERSSLFTETYQPGLYLLRGRTIAGEDWQGGFGVNAGSALESDLRVSAQPLLRSIAEGGVLPTVEANQPEDLWPWLVLFVLFLMIVEAGLSWR